VENQVQAKELQRFTDEGLRDFYATLAADRLPVGRFQGYAWLVRWPWTTRLFGSVWAGKVFGSDATVMNRILGHLFITGRVRLEHDEVVIDYPQLRVQDRLRPVTPLLYLGSMKVWRTSVYFTLEAV